MATVRYRSPDDPAFLVFDRLRFRIEHADFLLTIAPLRAAIVAKLEEHRGWDLRTMKLVQENRRLESCLEWLTTLGDDPLDDVVAIPGFEHEPAVDLVADRLVGEGHYEKAICPACEVVHDAGQIRRDPWQFEEDGTTVRGLSSTCPAGHTIHALIEGIDTPDLESPDD
jgi:hypothetical protein